MRTSSTSRRDFLVRADGGLGGAALVATTVPGFRPQNAESRLGAADATPGETLDRIHANLWYAALLEFPGFALLRITAERVWAGALLDEVRSDARIGGDMDEREWHALRRLGLIAPEARPGCGRFVDPGLGIPSRFRRQRLWNGAQAAGSRRFCVGKRCRAISAVLLFQFSPSCVLRGQLPCVVRRPGRRVAAWNGTGPGIHSRHAPSHAP